MRRKLLLTLVTALTMVGNAVGQTMPTLTEGFENATTSTNYQKTVTIYPTQAESTNAGSETVNGGYSDCGIGWDIYYGTPSTTNAINGSNSVQLRSYSSATSNLGYLHTTTAIENLKSFTFYAMSNSTTYNIIKVQTSTDGETWTDTGDTFTLTTSAAQYSYTITNGATYIGLAIANSSNSTVRYTFDDFVFTYETDGEGGDSGETVETVETPTATTTAIRGDENLFTQAFTVSLATETEDATIYYTLDGTTPTAESTLYSNAITISDATTTLSAIAIKGEASSEVLTETYTYVAPINLTEEITFTDFQKFTSNYGTGAVNTVTASDESTYDGFYRYYAMYNKTTVDDADTYMLQLRANTGVVTLPAVQSTNGFTLTVTYSKASNYFDITYGTSTVTSASAGETGSGTGGTATLEISGNQLAEGIQIQNNKSGALYISEIKLTPLSSVAKPTISASESDEDGNITVTITAADEATIYYTTDGTIPTTDSEKYTEPFTVSTSCTVTAIAVLDGETSSTASETISFPVAGIRGIRDAILDGETSGTVTLTDAVVTYVSGNYNYIQDGTSPDDGAGIVLYKSSTGLTAGQTISGTMEWSGGQIYNGLSEITALDYTELGTGEVPTAYEVTASTLAANIEKYESYYISVPFTVSEATTVANKGSYNVNDAGTVALYNSNSNDLTLAATDATFTGYTYNYQYNSNEGTTANLYVYSQSNISQTGSYTLSAEYGTFYSPVAFTAPSTDNLTFETVPSVTGSVLDETPYAEGAEIPAQTGLLVKGSADATASFSYLNFSTETAPTDNLLHGADALDTDGNTYVEGDYLYYYLTIEDGTIGFYWGAEDGAAFDFSENTNKAFLAVPTTVAVRGFSLGGTSTGIESVENATDNNNAAIYNLAGQRVSKATKGVYIQNGRKFVVK